MGIHIVCQLTFSVMLIAVFCLGSVVSPSVANATVYYVATTGNDGNPGSQSQPFRTMNKGVSILQPGDTLYIRQGTYAEAIRTSTTVVPSGTSWSNAITISGYPNEAVTLTGEAPAVLDFSTDANKSYIIFSNLILDSSSHAFSSDHVAIYLGAGNHHIRIDGLEIKSDYARSGPISNSGIAMEGGADHVEVLNTTIHGWRDYGFYIFGAFWLLDHLTIYDTGGYGVQIYHGGANDASNNSVYNSTIYDTGKNYPVITCGIVLSSGSNNTAYNNVVRDNNGCGIQVTSLRGGTGTTVYNNTVTRNAQEGIYVYDSAPGTVIQNNIAYNNGGSYQAIRNDSTGSTVDHNVTTNPQFVNALANDFSLQAGSPAIDAGVVVSAITKDFKGTPRPRGVAYDIGAYEYSEGPTSLPAPKNLHMVVK